MKGENNSYQVVKFVKKRGPALTRLVKFVKKRGPALTRVVKLSNP